MAVFRLKKPSKFSKSSPKISKSGGYSQKLEAKTDFPLPDCVLCSGCFCFPVRRVTALRFLTVTRFCKSSKILFN